MNDDEFAVELRLIFLEELPERVEAMNRTALALEREESADTQRALLEELFRATHNLKGAARVADVPLLERGCHLLEDLLAGAREGIVPLEADLFDLVYSTADAVKDAAAHLRTGPGLVGSMMEALIPRLEAASEPAGSPQSLRTRAAAQRADAAPKLVLAPRIADRTVRVSARALDALLATTAELRLVQAESLAWIDAVEGAHAVVQRQSAHGLLARAESHRESDAADRDFARARGPELTLDDVRRTLDQLAVDASTHHRRASATTAEVERTAQSLRIVPFQDACRGLERVVRDASHATSKNVEMALFGGDVELDRNVVERLQDPLVHLVRNAIDHGIEPPAERETSGKPARATVTISARLRSSQVEIVVGDDGRGLDVDAIRARAALVAPSALQNEVDVAQLIFEPGFSTALTVTQRSGRGVGLDVVKGAVEALHGRIHVAFEHGLGTSFVINVPLTLTSLRALVVEAGTQLFALTTVSIHKVIQVTESQIRAVAGREMIVVDDELTPLVALADVLGLRARPRDGRTLQIAVVTAENRRVALVVDELVSEMEVVVKSFGPRIRRVRHIAAVTVLPSRAIALVINASEVIRTALARSAPRKLLPAATSMRARRHVLVADDSLTTRTLHRRSLEAAGYEVSLAVDGREAWRLIQELGADLVVSDVSMPRMDGIALTEAIRSSARFARLPIVLVTSLESEEAHTRGMAAGADAYLDKSTLDDKKLLDAIARLLPAREPNR